MKALPKALAATALILAVFAVVRLFHRSPASDLTHARPGALWRAPGGIGAAAAPTVSGIEIPSWFGQRGAVVRRIAGRVTFEGAPVAGATIELGSHLTDAGVVPVVERTSDRDGRFDFGVQPPARFSVAASAQGRAPAIVELDTRDPTVAPDQLELSLAACNGSLFGHVNDASGGPIAAARVCLTPPRAAACVAADASGAYSLCLAERQSFVTVSAPGYGAIQNRFEYSGRRVQRDYSLTPDATIVGRVVSADSNAPIANATVRLAAAEDHVQRFAAPAATTTNKDGQFSLPGVAAGRVRVIALADHYPPSDPVEVNAEPGRPTGQIQLRLRAGSHVRGVVTDGAQPIVGATISIASGQAATEVNAVTQSDGSFVIDSAPRGRALVSVNGYEVVEPRVLVIDRDTISDARVVVATMGSIAGHVSRQGQPLKGVRVRASGREESMYTDDRGAYQLRGLPPGHYEVNAESPKVGAYGQTEVTLRRSEHREGADIDLKYAASIAGTVVRADGSPLAGVSVRFEAVHAPDVGEDVTAGDGAFTVHMLMGGDSYRGTVRESARNAAPLRAADDAPTVVLVRDATSAVTGVRIVVNRARLTIAGSVLDSDGQPVPDAHVEAVATNGGRPAFFDGRDFPSGISKDNGSFRIDDLDEGTYDVRARAGDGSEAIVRGVQSGQADVAIKLQRSGGISGVLSGFSSRPVVKAVRMVPGPPQPPLFASVDATSFQLRGLSPGPYQVVALGGESDATAVEVRAGEIASVTLKSRGSGSIRGRVVEWKSGAPGVGLECVAGMRTSASSPAWVDESKTYSGEDGTFTIDHAPTGPISVLCSSPSGQYTLGRAELTVAASQSANCDVMVVKLHSSMPFIRWGVQFVLGLSPPQFSFVGPGSPAQEAGIRAGDAVKTIDGVDATMLLPMGADAAIRQRAAGSTVHVGLARGTDAAVVLR